MAVILQGTVSSNEKITMTETIKYLEKFIPAMELRSMQDFMDADEFVGLEREISAVPPIYATEHLGKMAPVKLHYFGRLADFFITELDQESGEAFGFVCMGNPDNAELGYMQISEILKIPYIELDLFWDDSQTLADVMANVKALAGY